MADEVFAFLWQMVLAGGGGAVVAWLLAQWLGKRWIESKFNERLEQLKHDQSIVVARLKVEIDSMIGGALKIQEREFDVLPGIWDRLALAFTSIQSIFYPEDRFDMRNLHPAELEEFLQTKRWTETQREQLRRAHPSRRSEIYTYELEFWHRLEKAKRFYRKYQRYLAANAIFFPPELKAKLDGIEGELWSVMFRAEWAVKLSAPVRSDTNSDRLAEERTAFAADLVPLRNEIEVDIRARLESHKREAANEKASAGEAL